jgi:hypothetical protein
MVENMGIEGRPSFSLYFQPDALQFRNSVDCDEYGLGITQYQRYFELGIEGRPLYIYIFTNFKSCDTLNDIRFLSTSYKFFLPPNPIAGPLRLPWLQKLHMPVVQALMKFQIN